jgi:hypothetical protein
MTKLQIKGTHFSYSILEFKKEDAMFLQSIMEKELVSYDQIFFERKDFKKLGYKNLEDIPAVANFSGYLSNHNMYSIPVGVFTLFENRKNVFESSLDRLEERYHMGLYKEFCELKSSISSKNLTFRKRKAFSYFFLKREQLGLFTTKLENDVTLRQLIFQNTNLHSLKLNFWTRQFVNVIYDNSILEFTVGKKNELKQHIESLN